MGNKSSIERFKDSELGDIVSSRFSALPHAVNRTHEWIHLDQAHRAVPRAPGIFRIGYKDNHQIDVLYYGFTKPEENLNELISEVSMGWRGNERMQLMMLDTRVRPKLRVTWALSVYPEELIEDEIEEYIATYHKVPLLNIPLDPSRGLWVTD